ncbi:MAG: helix-turn-helix domain-containing protein [Acidobacteriota bacterium]
MGNPAGVKRDFAALEQRRMMAVDLLRKGSSQSEVARQVGVHRQSVSRWAGQLKQGGRRSLRKAKHVGRPPRLDAADLRLVERGLKRGPEPLGFDNGLCEPPRACWRPCGKSESVEKADGMSLARRAGFR